MKYRPLDEVYFTGIPKDKPATPKKRKPIIESYRKVVENYMLQITDMDGNQVYSSEIPDEKLEVIQKDLDRSQKISVGDKEYTVYEILDRVLQDAGWKQSNRSYKAQILEPVKALFNEVNINRDNFGDLISIQADQDNPFRTQLLANPMTVQNFTDLVSSRVWNLFPSQQDAQHVIDGIWALTTKIGNISVGSGEIVITMFTDASKGAHGDLQFEGIGGTGEVEVKGCGARMGGDGYGHTQTVKSLNRILQTRDVEISVHQLDLVKRNLIDAMTARMQAPQTSEEARIEVQGFHDFVNSINGASDLDEVIASVTNSQVIAGTWKKEFLPKLKEYQKHLAGKVAGVFSGAINSFFRSKSRCFGFKTRARKIRFCKETRRD